MQFDKAVNPSWLEQAFAGFSTGLSTDFVDKVRKKWRYRMCYHGNLLTLGSGTTVDASSASE